MRKPPHFLYSMLFVLAIGVSCQDKKLEVTARVGNEISGQALMFSSPVSPALNGALSVPCLTAKVELFSLFPDGSLSSSALLTSTVNADGSFVLPGGREAGISFESAAIRHVLQASGCGYQYSRPLTSYSAQNITGGSSLLTFPLGITDSSKRSLYSVSINEAKSAIDQFDAVVASDTTVLLNQVIGSPPLTGLFQSLVNLAPVKLKELPPALISLTAPTSVAEGSSNSYSVSFVHWNTEYVPAYDWLLDGVSVGTSATWNYSPTKNSQGLRSVQLKVGTQITAGTTIDPAKMFRTDLVSVTVSNDFPAVAPVLTLVGSSPRNVTSGSVTIATGAAMVNCQTFSALAITENSLISPLLPSAFTINCTTAGTQTEAFSIVGGDGLRTLALWAIDADQRISTLSSSVNFVLDQTPPVLSLPNVTVVTGGGSASLAYTASDATSGLQSVILSFAADGVTFSPVVDLTASSPPYVWSVPNTNVNTAKLRLTAVDQVGNSSQVTTNAFVIGTGVSSLSILTPAANTPSNGTMTLTGACDVGLSVEIAGSGATPVSAVCTAGSYSQVISLSGADGLKNVTVTQTDFTGNSTTVNRDFYKDTVTPVVTLLQPTGGLILKAGDPFNVTWTATDANFPATPIKLEYSTNAGSTWTTIVAATANSGSYSWTLPGIDSSQFRVRVTATDLVNSAASTSPNFSIDAAAPVVTLETLLGGQILRGGASVNVNWTAAVDSNLATNPISLEYSANAGSTWTTIATALGNSGTYSWTVPTVTGDQYRMRVKAVDQVGFVGSSESTSNFTVDATLPVITLLTQTGGQYFANGTATNIQWSASDNVALLSSPIKIEYSVDSGSSWTTLVSGTTNSGSYSWTPTVDGSQYRIRVTATDQVGNTNSATSAADFSVSSVSPVLTQTNVVSPYVTKNSTALTFGGTCDLRAAIGGVTDVTVKLDGTFVTTVVCSGSSPTGTWTYTSTTFPTDGTRVYTFERTSGASITTSINATWIRDNVGPVFTNVIVNDGDAETVNSTVGVKVTGSDAATGISGMKVRVKSVDLSTGDCSTVYANNSWQDMTGSTTEFLVSISDSLTTKKICAWGKDNLGNISVLASPTSATGPDRDLIDRVNSTAPLVNTFTVVNNQSGTNQGTTNYALNDPVLIQWTATSASGFADNPLKLEYTTDGSSWITITQNSGGLTGYPTSYNSSYTAFNAPTTGFFRVRIQVKNKYGLTSRAIVSDIQNGNGWSVYAGNTGDGIGGNKGSLSITNDGNARFARYVETSNGDLYIVSRLSGIIKVDARTGNTSMFLKHGNINLPSNGYLSSSSLFDTNRGQILIDSNGYLYLISQGVSDSSPVTVYQVNPSTGAVRHYLGGGSVIDNTAVPTTARASTGRYVFDEANTLYYLANCSATWSSPGAQRMMKVTQNADGTSGTVSMVAGNCDTSTYPGDSVNALATSLNINGVASGFDFAVWNYGQTIYFYYRNSSATGNRALKKILNGTVYDTGLAVDNISGQGLTYDVSSGSLLIGAANLKPIVPNLAGSGGDTFGSFLITNSTAGDCAAEGAPVGAACVNPGGQVLRLRNGQLSFLENAGTAGSARIRAIGSDNTIRTIAGIRSYDNSSGTRTTLRTSTGSIFYKKSSLPNLGVFPEGLYFQDRVNPVWGRINTDGSVTELWGNTSNADPTLTAAMSIGTSIPYSAYSRNMGNFTFDDQGLPWFRIAHKAYSLDTTGKLVVRTSGMSVALSTEGTAGTSLNSMGMANVVSYSNLQIKGSDKIFILGREYTPPTYVNDEPWLRIYNFASGFLDDLMGGTGRGNTAGADSTGYENIANKSISNACLDGVCRTEFVENNPGLVTDDYLYFNDKDLLRRIENPTTPGSQYLSTLFTVPSGVAIRGFTVSPDGKRVFYVKDSGADAGKVFCHSINIVDETSWCRNSPASHTVVGPPSGMPVILFGPNQFTWKDGNQLLIANIRDPGEIYLLDLSKLGP